MSSRRRRWARRGSLDSRPACGAGPRSSSPDDSSAASLPVRTPPRGAPAGPSGGAPVGPPTTGAQAVIAIGGGVGTLSEIALALRIGTPVVGLHDSFEGNVDIPRVESPAEAVRWALQRARGVY